MISKHMFLHIIIKVMKWCFIFFEVIFLFFILFGVPIFDIDIDYDLICTQIAVVSVFFMMLSEFYSARNTYSNQGTYEKILCCKYIQLREARIFLHECLSTPSFDRNEKLFLLLCLILFDEHFDSFNDLSDCYIMAKKAGYVCVINRACSSKKLRALYLDEVNSIFDVLLKWKKRLFVSSITSSILC